MDEWDLAGRKSRLRSQIIGEILAALGRSKNGMARRLIAPVVWWPASRFAELAIDFDARVGREGFPEAARAYLPDYVEKIQVHGADLLPKRGPLLIASNHPGAYDFLIILSNLQRDDVKIITSTVPLVDQIPHVADHFIPVTREAHQGMTGFRQALRHLRSGGTLVTFASGIVDPDPDLLPGAIEALREWKPSLALLLKKVPDCQFVVDIVSGVVSPRWLNSPLTRIQPEIWRRRKLAEFFQIMQQMIFPGRLRISPRISFAPPVPALGLYPGDESERLHQSIINRATNLLVEHMNRFKRPVQINNDETYSKPETFDIGKP